LVGIREKSSPFVEGDQVECIVEEVLAYLASIIHKLCGIFGNPSIHIPFDGGSFLVEEGDLVFLFGLWWFWQPGLHDGSFKLPL
jgi:hypothetical protein